MGNSISLSIIKGIFFSVLLLFLFTCEKEEQVPVELATVKAGEVIAIEVFSAELSSTVEFNGGADVTDRGVCWSTLGDPIISDDHTIDGFGNGRFTSQLIDLEASTTYFVRAYATNNKGTAYSDTRLFTTLDGVPELNTGLISNITTNSATSGGTVIDNGGAEVTTRGICWNTTGEPTTEDSKTEDGNGLGEFTSTLSELIPNTTYFVRAYGTNAVVTAYGDTRQFTTLDGVSELNTNLITNITTNSATSGGEVIDDGGADITSRGICWNTTGEPTIADSKTADGTGLGAFISTLTNLIPNTTYYVRTYATNTVGTMYDTDRIFTTRDGIANVTTTSITVITINSAISGGGITENGGADVTSRGLSYNTTGNPTTADSKIVDGSVGLGTFTTNLTGLISNTTYYVRAFATNSVATTYGESKSFKTLARLPHDLNYDPNFVEVDEGVSATTIVPTILGDAPFSFSIKNGSEIGSFISINTDNGVISVDGSTSKYGDYQVDIEVINEFGTSLFTNAYTIKILSIYNVTNGFYITKDGEVPDKNAILKSVTVDAPSFSAMFREGFVQSYMYLTAGTYNLVNIENKAIVNSWGGSSQEITDGNAECDVTSYALVGAVVDGAAFTITTEGLYVVAYDTGTSEIVYDQIETAGIIGDATPSGWSNDTGLTTSSSITTDGATWTLEGVTLDVGQMKFRYNCRWAIDRRIDKSADFDNANGYSFFTNYGGEIGNILPGNEGANIPVNEYAVYTVVFYWDPEIGVAATLTKTGEAEPKPQYPNELYMIGAAIGGWDWVLNGIQMVPVHSNPHLFWKIVWMEALAATEGIKFAPQLDWINDFGRDSNISPANGIYAIGSNTVPPPTTSGYYSVVVNLETQTIEVNAPLVHGIGDAFGSWDSGHSLFAVDNLNGVITSPAFSADGNLRIYTTATTLTTIDNGPITDWWQTEFTVLSGMVEYRGTGDDLATAPVSAGQTVSLNFKDGTGTVQ